MLHYLYLALNVFMLWVCWNNVHQKSIIFFKLRLDKLNFAYMKTWCGIIIRKKKNRCVKCWHAIFDHSSNITRMQHANKTKHLQLFIFWIFASLYNCIYFNYLQIIASFKIPRMIKIQTKIMHEIRIGQKKKLFSILSVCIIYTTSTIHHLHLIPNWAAKSGRTTSCSNAISCFLWFRKLYPILFCLCVCMMIDRYTS